MEAGELQLNVIKKHVYVQALFCWFPESVSVIVFHHEGSMFISIFLSSLADFLRACILKQFGPWVRYRVGFLFLPQQL